MSELRTAWLALWRGTAGNRTARTRLVVLVALLALLVVEVAVGLVILPVVDALTDWSILP